MTSLYQKSPGKVSTSQLLVCELLFTFHEAKNHFIYNNVLFYQEGFTQGADVLCIDVSYLLDDVY